MKLYKIKDKEYWNLLNGDLPIVIDRAKSVNSVYVSMPFYEDYSVWYYQSGIKTAKWNCKSRT